MGQLARLIGVLALLLLPVVFQGLPQIEAAPQDEKRPIQVGWSDEMNKVSQWEMLGPENPPKVSVPVAGAMRLTLGKVPGDWPYEYQWSGVTRCAVVDVARFPVASAYVSELLGYAHLDLDVLDAKGTKVKGFRSSTLQAGGVTFVDLGSSLDPAVYTFRVRIIIGGSNEGCWGTYNWVRFTSASDAAFLHTHPSWGKILQK